MSTQPYSNGKLIWRELLTADEINAWINRLKVPERLKRDLSFPGVYRFIYSSFLDENGTHQSCSVGQGGNVGKRLRDHFRPDRKEWKRGKNGIPKAPSGWHVRGALERSQGKCELQILTVEGAFDLNGVTINQDSFDDPIARTLLENLGLLYSEKIDNLSPTNRNRTSQTMKNHLSNLRASRTINSRKKGPKAL